MANTKKTTTRRAPRSRAAAATNTNSTTTAKAPTTEASTGKPSAAKRAGKAISERPVASAAIATGIVSGVAAAVAGFFAFKKSGKTFSEFSGDIATSVKDTASETKTKVKDGLTDAGTKAKDRVSKIRDGIDDKFAAEKTQSEIAEEALTLKETGKKSNSPVDPVIDDQSKVGSISY